MRDPTRLTIPEDFQLAAKKGAAFLDEHHPGWAEAINQIKLDLGDMESCVLGQLYGDYDDGRIELEVSGAPEFEMGFNLDQRRPWDWVKLTGAWLRQIRERV